MLYEKSIPSHIAIIMDGNGRWAKKRGLPRAIGHNAGMKTMKEIVEVSAKMGIKYLTVYAFSTENWKRSEEEVGGIFKLLVKYVDNELKELNKNNVKVNVLGDLTPMSQKVKAKLKLALNTTKDNTGLEFNIGLNYGARDEIIHGVKSIVRDVLDGSINIEDIDEKQVSNRLYTGEYNIPDPELVIRTSGEIRISNFLLWQIAYSELVFTDVLWPDFDEKELKKCIKTYQNRDRRFGGR